MDTNTLYVKKCVLSQKSAMDLITFIDNNKSDFLDWQRYINYQVEMRGCSYERFAKQTGFSKNTIKNWCVNGTMPQNRYMFIKLAFGLGLDVEQTNKLLTQHGKYSALYAKDLYDSIVIYVLNKRLVDKDNEKYQYKYLHHWFEKFKEIKIHRNINKKFYFEDKTIGVYNSILNIKEDNEFEKFILENKNIFFSSYSALVIFIEDFIEIRKSELEDENDENVKYSWHRYLKEKNLSGSFEKTLSDLKNHGILPKREQLISLGIHLNMVSSDIDKMLSLAHMRELYAKDKVESLLLYLLRNAVLTDPDLELNNACRYVGRASSRQFKKEYNEVIERYFGQSDLPEWEECIENLSDYIRDQLINLNMQELINEIL